MEIDLQTAIVVFTGWLLGGFASGVSGLGAMMLALPILSMKLSAQNAILTCCLVAFPCCLQLAWNYRKNIHWPDLKPLWLACIPGCLLGTLVLTVAPPALLELGIGILIAIFIAVQLSAKKTRTPLKSTILSLSIAGAGSGFTGSAVSIVGVPMGIFVLLAHWDKDRARGTMSMFFMLSTLITVCSQWAAGLYSMYLLHISLIGILGCLIGQDAGYRVGRHLHQRTFVIFVLSFLSCAAAVLCYKGIVGLRALTAG
ncbi:MAG: sulfite exporter TauE/SafE family protein [Desulfovibrio sp.]|nr:sulfite exporter TauE/SafE family protein [Desulfovibrio sp.]